MADVGDTVDGYKLRAILHPARKTTVFEVVEGSGRHFAMKMLLPEIKDEKEAQRELFNDAEVGLKMRHENVINILKVSKDAKKFPPYFIMEYFPAGSLRNRLQSRNPADKQFVRDRAKSIFKQSATGLAYLTASGFIHKDIKPDNILCNASGKVKIIDFAIAQPIKSGLLSGLFGGGRPKSAQGTYSYMSPEQIQNLKLDARSDVYAFGCTLYELVTGTEKSTARPPFRGASTNEILVKHLKEKPPPPSFYNPDVTDEFSNLVLKMLAKKPDDRPPGFHEVLMELKKCKVFKSVNEADDEQQM
jgi:serine/threonine protein kinase